MDEYTESIEQPLPFEMTKQDEADLEALNAPPPEYHTILEVWREVLKPAADDRNKPITPAWANKITSSFAEVNFADMGKFHALYFDRIEELVTILAEEIKTDDDCLSYSNPDDDKAENREHYLNLLRDWQAAVLRWELDWEFYAPDAAVDIASMSEVHKMFFGQTGIVAFLESIAFEFHDDDQAELAAYLEAIKEGS